MRRNLRLDISKAVAPQEGRGGDMSNRRITKSVVEQTTIRLADGHRFGGVRAVLTLPPPRTAPTISS